MKGLVGDYCHLQFNTLYIRNIIMYLSIIHLTMSIFGRIYFVIDGSMHSIVCSACVHYPLVFIGRNNLARVVSSATLTIFGQISSPCTP